MTTSMSPARARGTRREQLEADVSAGALCADSDEDYFREPGESGGSWTIRREGLRQECAACPVLAQCRELALRYDADVYDIDRDRNDCMVRGGMTARQIAIVRRSARHSRSLAKAVLADRRAGKAAAAADQERAQINRAALRLRRAAAATSEHASRDWLQKNNAQVRALADDLAARRTARRQRNGWTTAA